MEGAPQGEQADGSPGGTPLPVLQSTLDALWLVKERAGTLLRTGWLPALVLTLCSFAAYALTGDPEAEAPVPPSLPVSLLIFALTMISFAAEIALLVRWYRALMLPHIPDQGLRLGRRELRVLVATFGMALCAAAPIALVIVLLVAAGKVDDRQAAALPVLLAGVLSLWIYSRLMLMPALAALDAGGALLPGSWRIMRGYALRAFAISLLASLPLVVVALLGFSATGAAGLLVELVLALLRTVLMVAVSAVVMHRIAPVVDPVY